MELSAAHIGELAQELSPLCAGREVREVRGLVPNDLLIVLAEGEQRVRRLRLSADPLAARVHLQIGRVASGGPGHGPFFRAAGERLPGTRLVELEQVAGDRIVRLCFRGDGPATTLVAELAGRHANMLLLDAEERILAVLRPPKEKARGGDVPRLALGQPWSPPPGGDPRRARGLALAEALPEPPGPPPVLAALAPLSWRVEAALGSAADEHRLETLRHELVQRLERRLTNARSLLAGLRRKQSATAEAERVRQDGELLKASLGRLARGADSIELPDWFTEGTPARRIALDPRLDGRQNVERCFARYKKLLRSLEKIPAEIARAEDQVARGERWLARATEPGSDPEELERAAIADGWLRPRQESAPHARTKGSVPAPRLPYRRFAGSRGSEIRVGRSAADNDRLSFRESRGNDLWLHTVGSPGSHVVLRVEKGREPDPEEVLDAAHLALHYSPLRGARRAQIHVARCKELRKPRGAPAGLVTLSGGRTLSLRVEPARLERLLRGAPPG